jgi:PBSX family phage terminase large subunit
MISVDIPKKAFLPCYHHLLKSTADIDFLWGGRDSGKSRHIAQQLVVDCMRLPYFRCVLARKVFNTIKESQYQLIKDVVSEWGLEGLFTFNQNPLEIKCINGNKFICRGMDEPGKLKSISNPSHCWAEEMNQLSMDDFIVIMTSLRYNQGRVKVWCSFNPEADGDYHDYWLYKTFFANQSTNSFSSYWSIPLGTQNIQFSYQSTHTTYKQNKFCKPERAAFLEQLAALDPYYYTVFTLGLWGNRKVDDPFCYCFDRGKHVGKTEPQRALELYLSFDFNVNPITCGVYQHAQNKIWGINSLKLENSNIYLLCDKVIELYPGFMIIVNGDATGKNTSALVQDGINYYTVIKNKLNLSINQLKVPTVNPPIEENRTLVNAVFHNMEVVFDEFNCKSLIFDCQNVSVNDLGKIDKGDRSNPKKRADHLDNWRYYCNSNHKGILRIP